MHRRHQVTADGFYRGKQVIAEPMIDEDDDE
jgi:ribosomal protein L32